MGWHPTSPAYSNFPGTPKEAGNFIRIKRGAKGHKEGPPKPMTIQGQLVKNARARGYINGVAIKKKGG